VACSLSDQALGRSDPLRMNVRVVPVMSNRMAAKGIAPFAPEGNKRRGCAQGRMSDLVGSEDWPSGPGKYETFGAGDDAYGEGATAKLGPANLTRHSDGSVEIDGKKVDNPDDYKGEPIAGGLPTDDS
jgi:hypothetical protein